jgi:hypothetical protein
MRKLLLLTILFLYPVSFATAQEADRGSQALNQTRIEADNDSGMIRFIVKGEVAAVLTEDGFHVRRNVKYGGSTFDYGEQDFEKETAPEAKASVPEYAE